MPETAIDYQIQDIVRPHCPMVVVPAMGPILFPENKLGVGIILNIGYNDVNGSGIGLADKTNPEVK